MHSPSHENPCRPSEVGAALSAIWLRRTLVVILGIVLTSPEAFSGDFVVFGPERFVPPVTATRHFSVLDPQIQYVLRIENAGVTADITLNGTTIFARPKDSKSGVVTRPVTLLAENQLTLELRGPRGSHLTLQITGTDSVPPTITTTVTPTPNEAGWNNTDVTVSFSCEDATSGMESCPAPVTLSSEGAGQLVKGVARDRAGNTAEASVTINIDKTPPQLAITSPSPGAIVDTPSLTVTGTVSDALSGIASVTCNGTPASVSSETFTCSVTLISGSNTITVSGTDVAGNSASAAIKVSLQELDDIPIDKLQEFLNKKGIDSAAKFLERLPEEYKEHWIMMTRSESAQKGTATEPRLLVPSKDSSKVFSFCTGEPCATGENFIEYLQFDTGCDPATNPDCKNEFRNKFRFHEIDFPKGQPAKVKVDDPDCRNCHFTNPRPNWDAYESWGGMLPFNRDRIYEGSEEEAAFKRLLKELQVMGKEGPVPVFEQLLDLPRGITRDANTNDFIIPFPNNDPGTVRDVFYQLNAQGLPEYTGCNPPDTGCNRVPVMQGGNYYLFPHSKNDPDEGRGVELFDNFTGLNAQRVAQELLDHPRTPVDVRPLALAIASDCDFVSERASSVASFNGLLLDTDARRHSLPQLKANLEAENLGGLDPYGLIRVNQGVQPTPEEITMQIALRSRQGFNLDLFTGFMIDREVYGDQNTTIALFRLFLEPLGVQVQRWSMGVLGRSETYTFADLFFVYISEIQAKLTQDLAPKTCDELKTLSKPAIDAALPICGNGIVTPPEQCDDGNTTNGDGCSATCTVEPVCGDGVVTPPEQCDDGNTTNGDGCSATCTVEPQPPPPFSQIQMIFEDASKGNACTNSGCHSGTFSPDLRAGSSHANLVNVPSTACPGKDRVEPGDAANSCLFLKVDGAPGILGSKMPPGCSGERPAGTCLSQDQIDVIKAWINGGALQ